LRERERERDRQTDRQTEKEIEGPKGYSVIEKEIVQSTRLIHEYQIP